MAIKSTTHESITKIISSYRPPTYRRTRWQLRRDSRFRRYVTPISPAAVAISVQRTRNLSHTESENL